MTGSVVENTKGKSRFERKLPLERFQYQELAAAFRVLGVYPKRTYSDREIHSVYLDTVALDCYASSVSGVSRRFKLRVRWYQNETMSLFLEVKRKNNKVSTKQQCHIVNSDEGIQRNKLWLQQLAVKNRDVFPPGIVGVYQPVLEVSYQRSYFQFSSGIRMTVDRNIRYRRLVPNPLHSMENSPVDYVVEFKYPVDQINAFGDLLRNIPFRLFRHSKYVVGLDTVGLG